TIREEKITPSQRRFEKPLDMAADDLRHVLEELRAGRIDIDAALGRLRTSPVAELEFAHVDLHRRDRCGFPEVIFCQGKTAPWVPEAALRLVEAKKVCLATGLSDDHSAPLAAHSPAAQQDRLARTFWLPVGPPAPPSGKVVVITAGTADLPV